MEPQVYSLAAKVEERHWWFEGRRAVLGSVIEAFAGKDRPLDILEVGCGNGGNLPLLSSYGRVHALEMDQAARQRADARGLARVEEGCLPGPLGFGEERFDLIAALDVLEHVDDDAGAVEAMRSRLKPRGLLLITVPAYAWLWSRHDLASRHRRRYSKDSLGALIRRVGLDVAYASYFNFLLFPAAVAQIKIGWILKGSAMNIPPEPVNKMLKALFSLESRLIPRVSFPYGLSIVLCARNR